MQDQRLTDIKEKMDAWGIKQQWLAHKLGVHRAHLNQWLKGTITMPEEKIKEAKKVMDRIPEPN